MSNHLKHPGLHNLFIVAMMINFAAWLFGSVSAESLTDVGDCLNRYDNPTDQCTVGIYTDVNCQNLHNTIVFGLNKDTAKGCGECRKHNDDPNALKGQVYMKAKPEFGSNNKLAIELDNTCPLEGLTAAIATISKSSQCIQVSPMTGDEGIVCFPNGYDAPLRKIAANTTITHVPLKKRDASCKKLIATSQEDSHSPIKRTSKNVNCGGASAPCPITEGAQHTESISSSFSLSTGGAVSGVDIGASFGTEYTVSQTTTISTAYNVPANQCGYLSSFYPSTLFKGTWTECDGPDQEGEANVIKNEQQTDRVVITTC